jgi:hypothetical protein
VTQEQITELQKVYKELMAEIGAYVIFNFSVAVHDITKEVVLFFSADGGPEAMRVLKQFKESDCSSIIQFIAGGGCSTGSEVYVTEEDLNDRGEITISELLDKARIKKN